MLSDVFCKEVPTAAMSFSSSTNTQNATHCVGSTQCKLVQCGPLCRGAARLLCPTALPPPLLTPRKAETLKADTAAVARRYYTRKEWVKDNLQPNTRNARGTLVASRLNDPSCIRRGHSGWKCSQRYGISSAFDLFDFGLLSWLLCFWLIFLKKFLFLLSIKLTSFGDAN